MTRADAAAWIGKEMPDYLTAAERTAADDDANIGPAIDAALLAMGYSRSELATAEPTGDDNENDYVAQLEYHALRTIVKALGAKNFDVGISGNSFRLEQIRKHAKEDLADARNNVLAIFGGIITFDLNYLDDECEVAS